MCEREHIHNLQKKHTQLHMPKQYKLESGFNVMVNCWNCMYGMWSYQTVEVHIHHYNVVWHKSF